MSYHGKMVMVFDSFHHHYPKWTWSVFSQVFIFTVCFLRRECCPDHVEEPFSKDIVLSEIVKENFMLAITPIMKGEIVHHP